MQRLVLSKRWRTLVSSALVLMLTLGVPLAALADTFSPDKDVLTAGSQTGALNLTLSPGGSQNVSVGALISSSGGANSHVTFPVPITISSSNQTGSTVGTPSPTTGSITGYTNELTTTVKVTAPSTGLTCGVNNSFSGKVEFDAGTTANLSPNQVSVNISVTVPGPACTPVATDSLPPVVTVTFGAPDGNNGWFITSPVSGTVTATDPSTVADISCSGAAVGSKAGLTTTTASAPLTVTTQGATIVSCTATDGASSANTGAASGSANTVTVKLDTVKPVLTLIFTPSDTPDGANGWWKTAGGVGFTWSCSDVTSTIDSSLNGGCPSPLSGTVTTQGPMNFSHQVKDLAGNVSDPVNRELKLDNVAPTGVTGALDRAPDSNGWYNQAVGVTFSGQDATSGIGTCEHPSYSGPDSATASVNGTCQDKAGNTSAPATSPQFKYDATKPVLNITGPANNTAFNVCTPPTRPSFSPTDATSLVNTDPTKTKDTWTTPSNPSGVGTYTYTALATDNAGNSISDTRTYTVTYGAAVGSVLQPLNADGSSRVKLGSTLPVKFQIVCNGTPVANAVAKLNVKLADEIPDPGVDEAISTAASTTGNLFRYDATSQQYIFNLSTKQGFTSSNGTVITAFTQGTWTLSIVLDDGTSKSVNIQLVK